MDFKELSRQYIKSQIQEISSYKSLMGYGALLSFIHVLSFFLWHNSALVYQYLTKTASAICWPQLSFCESFRLFSGFSAQVLLFIWLGMALLAGVLFLNKKTVTIAYWLFLIINLIKLYIFLADYRLMESYHYLPFFISFVFLFIRQKLFFIPLLITCFYFYSGLLKIGHADWLSSLDFSKTIWPFSLFNKEIAMAFSFYILCAEMIGSWLLIFKGRLKAIIFIQFMLFYIAGFFVWGLFYPLSMLSLLSLFPLLIVFNESRSALRLKACLPGGVFVGVIVLASSISFIIPGDAGLTGEGRLYGINMPDTKAHCNSQIMLKFKNKTLQEQSPKYGDLPPHLRCDPYIDFQAIKKICAYYKTDKEFIDLDWSFYSQRNSEIKYKQIVDEENVCGQKLKYSTWRKNHWIKTF